jgi:(p)ppGpp synthase/HD superfamily hydrolase
MTFKVKVRQKGDNAVSAFALERHGSQAHGSLKIEFHLADVAWHARMHYDPHVNILEPEQIIAAAWLHDVLEDTPTTLEEIEDMFGYQVADVVNLLTDKSGRNRLERHLKTYHAIRTDPDATLIKLCDRRHNQDRSLKHGEHWMVMYKREYTYFKFALWTPHKFKKLWEELDWQHEEMVKKLTW